MQQIKALTAVMAAIGAAVLAVWGALYELFADLTPARIAGVVTLGIVALAIGALAVLWITARLWHVKNAATHSAIQDERGAVIEAQYRELQDYRPPQPQLPAPRVINVPRYTWNGQAQPFNMTAPAPQIHLQTMTEAGESLSVPLAALMRFLSLTTPARSEWTGNRELYGAALAFCETHGLLDRRANGGAAWRSEYPLQARREWAMQFDTHPTDTGAQGYTTGGQR